ncbi:MAG: pyruvate synthase subunit PorA [Desulfobacteraceae bacterium 4572_130]|nr:MAG: pyruvate synthase subunit PorA [Desulfobacteraceae bacterium 4572_130]
MKTKLNNKSEVKVMTGNETAALAATLCRPDIVAAYPITPQTEVVEKLAQYHASGKLDAEIINVEGENSAMNSITAASLAGGRVFTATSSWGLVFMYDAILVTAGARAPVVMVNVNRETPGMIAVSSGQQDMISTRDCGWIFLIAEDCQEILDMVIMAYRLAEDHDIQIPVMVHYDGFYLSYMAERVEIPFQKNVDDFLSVLKQQPERTKLMPGELLGCGSHGILGGYMEMRHKHCQAMERAKGKFEQINLEFEKKFNKNYGGQVEEYKLYDADIALLASGSMCGTIKTVIDEKRKHGIKIGLLRLRMFRPFPNEKIVQALKGKKCVGVVDRSLCFGFKHGPICVELRSFLSDIGDTKILSFIDGIANTDIKKDNVKKMIDLIIAGSKGEDVPEVTWVSYDENHGGN